MSRFDKLHHHQQYDNKLSTCLEKYLYLCRNLLTSEMDEIETQIIENIAYINSCDMYGQTALYKAVTRSNTDIIKILVKHGASLKIKTYFMDTNLLIHTIRHDDFKSFKTLLTGINSSSDINMQNNTGDTALMYSLISEKFKYTEFLLENGADITIHNNKEESPLKYIIQHKHYDLIKPLLKISSGNKNEKHVNIVNAIFRACIENFDTEWINFLLQNNVKIFLEKKYYEDILNYGIETGNVEILKLLIHYEYYLAEYYAAYILCSMNLKYKNPKLVKLFRESGIDQSVFEFYKYNINNDIYTNNNCIELHANDMDVILKNMHINPILCSIIKNSIILQTDTYNCKHNN